MWVKICGWRTAEMVADALSRAHEAGSLPDAIGLNFYDGSPRCVDVETAQKIVGQLPEGVEAVGLFVDHSVEEVCLIAEMCGLETLQLHGDYPAEEIGPLARYRLIRVYRLADESLDEIRRDLEECSAWGIAPWACLVEARVEGAHGGTGVLGPWNLLKDWPSDFPPLILAGGLTPENVATAIAEVRPWGVDTASGVEEVRGDKHPDLVRTFVTRARAE